MVRQMILNTFFDDPIANERFKAKIVHYNRKNKAILS